VFVKNQAKLKHVCMYIHIYYISLNLILESFAKILRKAPVLSDAVDFGYNAMQRTEYFVSL